ncbi:MAG: hypothetical protein IJU69_01420 [Bacteroidales bacterium]|nr:hypothetical protein [Bacteroidales bacterium]
MSQFNFDEFMDKGKEEEKKEEIVIKEEETEHEEAAPEIDVQKAVVEELAAEKVEMTEKISSQSEEIAQLREKFEKASKESSDKAAELDALKAKLAEAEGKAKDLSDQLAKIVLKEEDQQVRNPNALALLDRDVEIPDRFPGETRDHVIEVIREARDKAEAEGRNRRAQLLESVLVANEPNGTLAQRRAEIEKLFAENGNIVSGPVIEELTKRGISHKNGEEYLMPSEIINRNF